MMYIKQPMMPMRKHASWTTTLLMWSLSMTKKKRYYPNNWKAFKDTPDEAFEPIEFDVLMEWKIGGYEIPQSVAALVREKNLDTGKIKEYVYKYRHAAKKKCRKLMIEGNKEITIVQQDTVHFINPKEYGIFD